MEGVSLPGTDPLLVTPEEERADLRVKVGSRLCLGQQGDPCFCYGTILWAWEWTQCGDMEERRGDELEAKFGFDIENDITQTVTSEKEVPK